MNGDTTTTEAPARAPRKPRPEIQIYRPGALRQGGSTKSLAAAAPTSSTANDERPPRPEKLNTTTSSGNVSSRRRSNDTDSVTSRGGSGSTTPDAQAMNERGAGRHRFDRGGGDNYRRNDGPSNYNSTQSLYDTRQQGGYMEYNGGGNTRSNPRNGGRFNNQNNHHYNRQHPQQQPFERPGNYSRGFNERASMRGDGAIARRPQGSRRQRNDSINSTQSEMPPQTNQLHIDTSFDSASQCGASSNFSMNSLGEAFSFEEMCQNLQNFASMDWSKEVENEFLQKEEEEERRLKEEQEMREAATAAQEQQMVSPRRNNRKNNRNRRNNRYDESDRESSFGGSIAEEIEEEEEELKSGERTPTSVRSGQSYNPRLLYQRTRGATNDENHHGRRQKEIQKDVPKKEPRRYRGEHDDRDDDTSEYSGESHMTSGRLAGRVTIVPRVQNVQNRTQVVEGTAGRNRHHKEDQKIYQKRSQNQSEMANRAEINRRRQEEIDRNEGRRIKEIGEKMDKLTGQVKKRDVKAAERISEFSLELANIYSQIILQDIIYSFTAGLEQKLFRQAFYKSIECLRTGSNSASPDARLIRAATQKLLLNGILFYEQLISTYEQKFEIELNQTLTWQSGYPTDEELCSDGVELPVGIQKYESAAQKTAVKSLSRHLISLGDLHRYKSLIDGSENYETSKSCYQKSSQLWPSTGHPYNQLGIVVYYSMLYRSARRARLVPVDVLSKQRQKRVIDEFFYLTRALACSHPYEVARDRLKQRLDAMRTKVSKYQPVLDKECGIVKEQGNVLRKLQVVRQIWIHPVTEALQDGTGEKAINDVLSHFLEHSKAKLHRRAVSYLSDTFGLLVTKIGMEHFDSVSERAFGLLYASLAKAETDFTPDQLVKLAAMFIYAVQANFEKASTSSSTSQLQLSVNTLFTYFLTLLEHISNHQTLLLPAINVLSTWILHSETEEILKTINNLEPLDSTILPGFSGFEQPFEAVEKLPETPETAYPEAILLASFFKIFESIPVAMCRSRTENLIQAIEKLRNYVKTDEDLEENRRKLEELELEEPKSREQIVAEERGKGTAVIVIHPEYLIPDTNVFIGELQLVKELLEVAQELKKFQILVPTIVLDELQSISRLSATDAKSNSEAHDPDRISKSKAAVAWLKEQSKAKTTNLHTLTSTGKRLPSLIMAAEDLETAAKMTNDDMILKSAEKWSDSLPQPSPGSVLQQVASGVTSSESVFLRNCILITGDRGLTIKAIGNNFPCRGITNFTKWMGSV